MKYLTYILLVVAGFMLFVTSHTHAAQFFTDGSPSITSPLDDDSFLFGDSVLVTAPITGDTFAAGKNITIKDKIAKSVYLAGTNVFIEGGVGHNVWAAGQLVSIKGDIDHDVYVVADTLIIDPNTHIRGQLRVAAVDVTIAGSIDGDAYITATTITTSADYGKNAKLDASRFHFTGGSVAGNLTYRTDKAVTDFGKLTVKGSTHFEAVPNSSESDYVLRTSLLGALAMLITGAALILFAGRKVNDVTEMVQTKWVRTFGVGLATFFIGPVLALVLILTNVGFALGLILLALYAAAIYTAGVIGYMIAGIRGMKLLNLKHTSIWVPFILALIVLGAVLAIPDLFIFVSTTFFVGVVIPTLGAEVLWWKSVLQGK